MTVTQVLRSCEEAVATSWGYVLRDYPLQKVRFFLPDNYTVTGGRAYTQSVFAVACDRYGFNPFSSSSNTVPAVARLLDMHPSTVELICAVANAEEVKDQNIRNNVLEIRVELISRLVERQRQDLHTHWSLLKKRS